MKKKTVKEKELSLRGNTMVLSKGKLFLTDLDTYKSGEYIDEEFQQCSVADAKKVIDLASKINKLEAERSRLLYEMEELSIFGEEPIVTDDAIEIGCSLIGIDEAVKFLKQLA